MFLLLLSEAEQEAEQALQKLLLGFGLQNLKQNLVSLN